MVQTLRNVQQQEPSSQREFQLKLLEKPQTQIQGGRIVHIDPEGDPEAFLLVFECASEGALWPKEQCAMRLASLIARDAPAIYQDLPHRTAKDYDRLKNAILSHLGVGEESCRKKFRSLIFTAGAKPQKVARELQDWGRRWLKPETRSAAEIVELLIVEQFIQILPAGAREWLKHQQVCSLDSIVELTEEYLAEEECKQATKDCQSAVPTPVWEEDVLTEGTIAGKPPALIEEGDQTSLGNHQDSEERESSESCFAERVNVKSEIVPRTEEERLVSYHQDCTYRERTKSSSAGFATVKSEIIPRVEEEQCGRYHQDSGKTIEEDEQCVGYLQGAGERMEDGEETSAIDAQDCAWGEGSDSFSAEFQAVKSEIAPRIEEEQPTMSHHQDSEERQTVGSFSSETTPWNEYKERNLKGCMEKNKPQEASRLVEERFRQCAEQGETSTLKSPVQINHEKYSGKIPHLPTEKEQYIRTFSSLSGQGTNNVERAYPCTEFGKCFSQNSTEETHQRIHTGETPFTYVDYGNSIRDPSALIMHQQMHTEENPYICSHCGKSFRELSILTKHTRIHTGEKPYICRECGKNFNDSSALLKHHRMHTGEKPYTCSICGKCFRRVSHMIIHQRIHTGEKPYACSECGKSFSRSEHLITHQRIHTGEQPYPCRECGKRFTQVANLVTHQRIHTEEKPYSCNECGKTFSHSSNLTRHQQIHSRNKVYVDQC